MSPVNSGASHWPRLSQVVRAAGAGGFFRAEPGKSYCTPAPAAEERHQRGRRGEVLGAKPSEVSADHQRLTTAGLRAAGDVPDSGGLLELLLV